eukprot:TRINITY_DN3988_c0_g1_i2.p1 TRINITY_DN3988_c0_g1~~TRINITY_DN3988_c0_g1_i2.p1  ORF type:complete len:225 (-),score=33.79 TRINITY_DN3988_c0_g1_i2:191-865(-)
MRDGQVLVGVLFCIWLRFARLPTPYESTMQVIVPPPLPWWNPGPLLFSSLAVFTFAAMSNGVNLTDGLDGLAASTCAAAYLGMSVAVMAIYPSLGIFGVSMAGACVGFLSHNRHKADVFMGDVGSLALGGGLAAMAAVSGMFVPLFLASFVFIIETLSVMGQVGYFKLSKKIWNLEEGRRWLRMAPFHHHLEALGFAEPKIVAAAFVIGLLFAIVAAYVGLISA